MEFENEDFSVVVPDYLVNPEQTEEETEEETEGQTEEETEEETEGQTEEQNIDYSSILQEMNTRLETIETQTVAYSEGINGLLANLYFIDFVAFTVFVFLMLFIVIKFFKQFF